MTDLLAANPLLLLFAVAAIGLPLGRIRVGGAALGSAAVLFVGIAFGAVDRRLRLPDVVFLLGLATLVYTIGLSSAGTFFRAFDRRGLRDTAVGLVPVAVAGVGAFVGARALGISGPSAAGMFSGAFTNASGLASAVDAVKTHGGDAAVPVVGYSLAYPVGVLTPILVMTLARLFTRTDLRREAEGIPSFRAMRRRIEVATVEVLGPAAGLTIRALAEEGPLRVVFGRVRREGHDRVASGDLAFAPGDLVTVVGPDEEIARVAGRLGRVSEAAVDLDRSEFDLRRVFVSDRRLVGRHLWELHLPRDHGAVVTRVRRGDLEFVPTGETILELGDSVRVLGPRERLDAISRVFGDSYRSLSDVDLLGLAVGMTAGLLLGLIPIPLPGGSFRLGFAGGPLVAALILGRLARTGPLTWTLPYSANLTLRQFGLLLFSAGIGTRAGYDFYATLSAGRGFAEFALGAGLSLGSGALTMAVGRALGMPFNTLFGVYAGAQTQPVGLAFAVDQTGNDLPTQAYARLFPLATVFKIVVGQLILAFR